MKRIVLFCAGTLVLSLSVQAQDLPKFDVFGGYSLFHFNQSQSGGNVTGNFQGGSGAAAYYPGKWFGIVGDFGGYKISKIKQGSFTGDLSGTAISYLFGPRIRFVNKSAVTPFGQILFGGVHHGVIDGTSAAICSPQPVPCKNSDPENTFAMAAEGGVDIKVARHFAVRGQGGYLLTRFKQDGGRQNQNDARISVGVVIH